MQSLLLITHAGTPFLLLPSLHYAPSGATNPAATQAAPPPTFAGTLTLGSADATASAMTVTAPPGLFTTANIPIPGLPPEITTHIRALPGIWCVALDPTGTILAEWPAPHPGINPAAVLALFPDHPFSSGTLAGTGAAPSSPYLAALHDGILTAALSHSWPPGHEQPSVIPSIPLGSAVAAHLFARVPVQPVPPAGGFFGLIAERYIPQSPAEAAHLATRKTAAIDILRHVVINGQHIGYGLISNTLDRGINIDWAAPTSAYVSAPTGPDANHPAPPPCGWDMDTRTVLLAPTLHPDLDAAYLGAGLYAAYGSLSGQATVTRLLMPALYNQSAPLPELTLILEALAIEAGRAWLLVAEIARALTPPTTATEALSQLPWGPPALAALPPLGTPDGGAVAPRGSAGFAYEAAIGDTAKLAGSTLANRLAPAVTALYRETIATRDRWFSPQTRAALPMPTTVNDLGSARSADLPSLSPNTIRPIPPFSGPTYISPEIVITREIPPRVIFAVPSPSLAQGPLLIHIPPGSTFKTATLEIHREDGIRVFGHDIPADDVVAIRNAQSVRLICLLPKDELSPPQIVPIKVQ